MTAYNFQDRFASAVASGDKCQTIRGDRANGHAHAGTPVQLYTGMRTAACRKLVDPDPICVMTTSCEIREDGVTVGDHPNVDMEDFALRDGFASFNEMKDWFRATHGLPFVGHLIVWSRSAPPGAR